MAKKDAPMSEEDFTSTETTIDEVGSFDLEGWEDVKPQQPTGEGDYELVIKSVKAQKSRGADNKPVRDGMLMVLEIVVDTDERIRPIFHRLWFPLPSDPPDNAAVMMEMAKETLDAFGYVSSAKGKIIPNELIGLRARAMVSLVAPTPKNRLRAPQNEVSRWLSGPNAPGIMNTSSDMF